MPRSVIGPGGGRFDVYEPVVTPINGTARSAPPSPSVEILPATAFTVEPIRWIWDGWLARGKLHLLAGAPGTGKTTIGVSIAAKITTGGRWPDGSVAEQGDVLIWTGEDGIADTLLPRLLAAGGDPSRVHFVNGMREHGKTRPFDPATGMPDLVQAAQEAARPEDGHPRSRGRRGFR